MDYIEDKTLYKAVMFARSMIRKGTPPQTAIYRAANYYQRNVSDVAHFVGQVAAEARHSRKRKRNDTNTG
jgi:hypothetical protein